MKFRGLPNNPTADPDVFLPLSERQTTIAMLIRSSVDPSNLAGAVRTSIREVDSSIAVYQVATMSERLEPVNRAVEIFKLDDGSLRGTRVDVGLDWLVRSNGLHGAAANARVRHPHRNGCDHWRGRRHGRPQRHAAGGRRHYDRCRLSGRNGPVAGRSFVRHQRHRSTNFLGGGCNTCRRGAGSLLSACSTRITSGSDNSIAVRVAVIIHIAMRLADRYWWRDEPGLRLPDRLPVQVKPLPPDR